MVETNVEFKNSHFSFVERALFRLPLACGLGPMKFVYGLKSLEYEDDKCCKALEVFYGFEYKDAKWVIGELVGNPMITNSHKSPTLKKLHF